MLPGATYSDDCTESSPCGTPQDSSSEASYYQTEGGYTACGSTEPDSASFVAMNSLIMGSGSNGNPLCGKSITVKNTKTGKTASGTVQDKCPGCHGTHGIDLSQGLFEQLADLSEGVFPVEWWFD